MASSPILLSTSADAASWVTALKNSALWLGKEALGEGVKEKFFNWLKGADVTTAQANSFHETWQFPVKFEDEYPLYATPHSSYFGIQDYPLLTGRPAYDSNSDVNLRETEELKRQKEGTQTALYYQGMAPKLFPDMTGERRRASDQDYYNMSNVLSDIVEAKGYPRPRLDDVANSLDIKYARSFCTCVGPITGYAARTLDSGVPADDYSFKFYKVLSV
jgi:hypothetical protein